MKGVKIIKDTLKEDPTATDFQGWLTSFSDNVDRYERLKKYYKGEQDILSRVGKIEGNANHRLVKNYCNLITNTLTGYIISKPVEYTTQDEQAFKEITRLFKINDVRDEDYELSKTASMLGNSFEILYYDTDGSIKFDASDPSCTFLIFDKDSLDERVLAGIRYIKEVNKIGETSYFIEYYTEKEKRKYRLNSTMLILEELGRELHFYKSIPIIEFKNNDERMSDFEQILTLQDAYNVVASDRTNNVTNVVNALLLLKGYVVPSDKAGMEQLARLKEKGVLCVDALGDANFITNTLDGTTSQEVMNDLGNAIHEISCCPNMSDEKFSGNSSGIAIKYKLWGTEQLIGTKERKLHRALLHRLKLIAESPRTKSFDWLDVEIVFTRNIPLNETEMIEAKTKLFGLISNESLYEQLEFLGIDSKIELERMKAQGSEMADEFLKQE